jgi:hypothetical protein
VSALADLVLAVHFGFVLFVVGGFAFILAGAALGWRWVRSRGFRLGHLAAIVFVALESLVGIVCPLTAWENALRGSTEDRSFVARWIARLLYYDFPEWVFAAAYVAFAVAVAAAWRLVHPRRREFPPPDDAGLR